MSYSFPVIRKKKRTVSVRETAQPSLPLAGKLVEDHVYITDPASIQYLSNNGCYGNIIYTEDEVDSTILSSSKRICLEQDDTVDSSCLTQDHTPLSQRSPSLKLSKVEALYLMHTSLITVTSSGGENLSIESLWREDDSKGGLLAQYVAYYHLRNSGWVPRCGLKFGVNFLLYEESPAHSHSTYAIIVTESSSNNEEGRLTWQQVMSTVRVNESASKEVVICCVTLPEGTGEEGEGRNVMAEREEGKMGRREKERSKTPKEGLSTGDTEEISDGVEYGKEGKEREHCTGTIFRVAASCTKRDVERGTSVDSLAELITSSIIEYIPVKRMAPQKDQRQNT